MQPHRALIVRVAHATGESRLVIVIILAHARRDVCRLDLCGTLRARTAQGATDRASLADRCRGEAAQAPRQPRTAARCSIADADALVVQACIIWQRHILQRREASVEVVRMEMYPLRRHVARVADKRVDSSAIGSGDGDEGGGAAVGFIGHVQYLRRRVRGCPCDGGVCGDRLRDGRREREWRFADCAQVAIASARITGACKLASSAQQPRCEQADAHHGRYANSNDARHCARAQGVGPLC